MKKYQRVCRWCGNLFWSNRPNGAYCGPIHRRDGRKAKLTEYDAKWNERVAAGIIPGRRWPPREDGKRYIRGWKRKVYKPMDIADMTPEKIIRLFEDIQADRAVMICTRLKKTPLGQVFDVK